MKHGFSKLITFAIAALFSTGVSAIINNPVAAEKPLSVCATVPELGSLAREVGGNKVQVTVFAKGTEDPHFVLARPSFIKQLNTADLLLLNGLELEEGWLPILVERARNRNILPGARGYLDASSFIAPKEVSSTPVDRSMGDVHALGNPHYLLDPLNGLIVARAIAERLSLLKPEAQPYFADRLESFSSRLAEALIGEQLAKKYQVEKIAALAEKGALENFLESQGELESLGGWIGKLMPYRGTRVVGDHNLWPYFADRYGLDVRGYMEPLPGLPPTTKHLKALIEKMKAEKVRVILASAYYDEKHANFVSHNTSAAVVRMAHQAEARPGTEDYLNFCEFNVRQLLRVLSGTS